MNLMDKGIFRFKRFACSHSRSSMKIGVDAVLLGAWAGGGKPMRIMDVGTGCGVIALMLAQRFPDARIRAIDVHAPSVEEAASNFHAFPWSDRLEARLQDFTKMGEGGDYDLIVSNPPYFDSGVKDVVTPREVARHESGLSPAVLLHKGAGMLAADGCIAMVVPRLRADEIIASGADAGLALLRRTDVRGNHSAPLKRSLLEFRKCMPASQAEECVFNELVLEERPGTPTADHHALCGDFYLKW